MSSAENNPIGFLQEWCQKKFLAPPKYEVISVTGHDHCKLFKYKCTFDGHESVGSSKQKQNAKSEAAQAMISLLKEEDYFNNSESTLSNNSKKGEVWPVASAITVKNPISALNEYCQINKLPAPQFSETSAAANFVCECIIRDKKTYGHGSNKKSAKTEAALKMCSELHIRCQGIDYLLQKSQNEREFLTEKNPISALQELCVKVSSLRKPKYVEQPALLNLFVIKCTVGKISRVGTDTTKKGAKLQAARKVLAKCLDQGFNMNRQVQKVQKNGPVKISKMATHIEKKYKPTVSIEKKDNVENDHIKPFSELDLSKKIASLNLSDQVIKNEQGDVTDHKTAGDSVSIEKKDNVENDHIKPFSELDLSKKIASLNLSDQVIKNEQGDVTDHKTAGDESFHKNSQVVNQSPKCRKKTPTSETLLKWAQNDQSSTQQAS